MTHAPTRASQPKSSQIGLISDVHANDDALDAVLRMLDAAGVTDIRGCGDMVGYNIAAPEVIDRLRHRAVRSVAGNHDRMVLSGEAGGASAVALKTLELTRPRLEERHRALLADLPVSLREDWPLGSVLMVHGTPDNPLWGYLHRGDVEDLVLSPPLDVLITGATHHPLHVVHHGTMVVNPGSVGLPRDGDPRPSFAIVDAITGSTSHHRASYDPSELALGNARAGIPPIVNDYLFLGGSAPGSVSLDERENPDFDDVAKALSQQGLRPTRHAAGMMVESGPSATGPMLMLVALKPPAEQILMRTTKVPVGSMLWKESPPDGATVNYAHGLEWVELAVVPDSGTFVRDISESAGRIVAALTGRQAEEGR